ncbi:unnamed protein product [Schistosoma haematobium]|nr:unnamed protein product [Schistosoma haematobium]
MSIQCFIYYLMELLVLSQMYRMILITFYIIIHMNHLFSLDTFNSKETSNLKKPIIIEAPNDHITNENILEFTCKAEANPKPLIIWYNASTNQPLEDKLQTSSYQTSIHVNKHLGKLMISNPIPGKSYSVYCNASNSIGWVISDPPVIGAVVYLNFEFHLNPSNTEADEGTNVTLECLPPKGFPKPQILWIKDNKTMINEDKIQNSHGLEFSNVKIMPNGNLRIHSASIKDTGNYACIALNPIGQRLSQSAYLHIKSLNHKYTTPKHIRIRQGQQVKLICPIHKNQSIKWSRKSKQPLIISERIQQMKEDLIIHRVLHSDSDIYMCTTLNGEIGEIHLTVETPPIFLKSPVDLLLNIGDKAKFICIANGNPKPGIYWELPDKTPIFPTDHTSLQSTSSLNRYIVHTNGTLEINSVTLKDAGKYYCIAHSSIDMVQTSAMLRIKRKKKNSTTATTTTTTTITTTTPSPPPMPTTNLNQTVTMLNIQNQMPMNKNVSKSIKYILPYIGLPPSNQTKLIGESVLIDCELPKLVKIISPNEYSNSNDHHHHHHNNNNKEYFDIQSTETWQITWKRSLISHNDTQQQHHQQTSKEIIDGIDHRYKIFPSGSLQINNLQLNDTGLYTCLLIDHRNISYQMTMLLNVLLYKINKTIIDYLQEYPITSPNHLYIINKTEQTITLTWKPPLIYYNKYNYDQSILSINYWIEIYTPKKLYDGWLIIERNWPINIITLNGLQYNIPYYIIIRARLGNGRIGWASYPYGPLIIHKNQYITKSIEIKNIQLTVLSPKSIHISWNLYEYAYILSQIHGYIIYYRHVEHMKCLHGNYLHNVHLMKHYCSLNPINYHTSINNNEMYHQLELMKQIYQEEYEQNNTDSITSLPGVISTITIEEHYKMNNNEFKQPIHHKVTTLLNKLKPFHCYEIGIKAFSNKFIMNHLETTDIFTHTALTYETSPLSPPRNIIINWLLDNNNNKIEVNWLPPPISDWNGIILGYIIYIHNELLNLYQTMNVSSNHRNLLIHLKKLPKLFHIQLAAYTCIGIGIKSESIKIDLDQKINLQKNDHELSIIKTIEDLKLSSSSSIFTNDSINDHKLIHQSWFISVMMSSLLAWCILFSVCLICWLHRNKFCKKQLTYQLSQSTNVDHKHCKPNTNNINDQSMIQTNGYSNHHHHISNRSITISSSSGEQTFDIKTQPQISYLSMRQSSGNNSNDSSKSYGLPYTEYSDESHMRSSSKTMDHFRTGNNMIGSPINNNNSIKPQLFQTVTRQFTSNSPYFTNDIHDPIKTNSLHFTSPSQTSSEPFDSAIYLEQISNKQQHLNDSSGSILTPPTLITTINGDQINDCINEQIYSPIVTPYATASIIPNENCDIGLQSPKQQIHSNNPNHTNHHQQQHHHHHHQQQHHHHQQQQQHHNHLINDNTSQNMYITCMDLANCQKATNIPSSL